MEIFNLICQEIDDFEKTLSSNIKTSSRNILNEYRTIVEDEHFGNLTAELSKIISRNKKRVKATCQDLLENEEILKTKEQYVGEIKAINQKAKEFNRQLSRKAKENRPASAISMNSEKGSQQKAYLIPRQKLRELDINSMKVVYDQTNERLVNYYAVKIQKAFRGYQERKNKARKAIEMIRKKKHGEEQAKRRYELSEKEIIKAQSLIRGHLARKQYTKLRKLDFGFRVLSQGCLERRYKVCLKRLVHYSQLRVKLHNREMNVLRYASIKDVAFLTMDRKGLKVISKLEGKFKMAECFYSSYRRSQIFYSWLILASRRKLRD